MGGQSPLDCSFPLAVSCPIRHSQRSQARKLASSQPTSWLVELGHVRYLPVPTRLAGASFARSNCFKALRSHPWFVLENLHLVDREKD